MSYIVCYYIEVKDEHDHVLLDRKLSEFEFPFYDATAFDSYTSGDCRNCHTLVDIEGHLELK